MQKKYSEEEKKRRKQNRKRNKILQKKNRFFFEKNKEKHFFFLFLLFVWMDFTLGQFDRFRKEKEQTTIIYIEIRLIYTNLRLTSNNRRFDTLSEILLFPADFDFVVRSECHFVRIQKEINNKSVARFRYICSHKHKSQCFLCYLY